MGCSATEFLSSGLGTLQLPLPEAESHNCDQHFCPPLGKTLWTLNPNYLANSTLAAPGVVLPDVDEDGVRDLVVLAVGESQVGEYIFNGLCFL